MPNALLWVNIATNIISGLALAISLLLDINNRKTTGLSSPNGIIGVIMRTTFLIWNILSPIVLNHAEQYAVEGASIAEQRIGVTTVFSIVQVSISLGVMCLFATFFYYWISVSALLPKSKLVGSAKTFVDQHPLAIPIFVAVYYLVYLCFYFGPLLMWKGQLLRYSFWRQLCQAVVQILIGCFLAPVLFYFIYALFKYKTSKSTVGDSENHSNFDVVSHALIRIIFTNIALIFYMVLASATLLVVDVSLIFQEIPLTHPLYTSRAVTRSTVAQAFLNLTGFSVSLMYLGKYIKVVNSI
ncbi:hypothetical protein BC833DRAFT_621182 [Globomyces pollinis-pini]|nr:hypothetical protein BC833DRAFT_621182 [Globomyces pollinis-pini]